MFGKCRGLRAKRWGVRVKVRLRVWSKEKLWGLCWEQAWARMWLSVRSSLPAPQRTADIGVDWGGHVWLRHMVMRGGGGMGWGGGCMEGCGRMSGCRGIKRCAGDVWRDIGEFEVGWGMVMWGCGNICIWGLGGVMIGGYGWNVRCGCCMVEM